MKVLVTGGGTGGHIYPAIAIANKIKSKVKDVEILFVGTEKGLESQLVPSAGYNLKTITVSGFRRKLSLDTLRSVGDLFIGIKDAIDIVKGFKPDVVIGTGGYVCGPVVFVAAMMNIKTLIHEQNVIPGVTNKILGRFVNKILVSFEESKKYFSQGEKIIVTGNPVRDEFLFFDRLRARQELHISDQNLVVTSFGGSRGAEKINNTMLNVIKTFSLREDITIFHITGTKHYDDVMNSLQKSNTSLGKNISIQPYAFDMPKLMAASDLIVGRAGAITLAEITAMGLPSILIPSPYVTNNHQEHNARVMEKNGASVLLLEKDLDDKNLVELLNLFLRDKKRLEKMAKNSQALSMMNATDVIFENIMAILKTK